MHKPMRLRVLRVGLHRFGEPSDTRPAPDGLKPLRSPPAPEHPPTQVDEGIGLSSRGVFTLRTVQKGTFGGAPLWFYMARLRTLCRDKCPKTGFFGWELATFEELVT